MTPPGDAEIHRLLTSAPDAGWRAFIDAYTPLVVSLIRRAAVRDRDETMEVYTLVCERLAADGCARLRRWDPARGALGAWLAVIVRRTIVDWVRSRAGRRRLFGSVQALDATDRRIFELYFWDERTPAEIAGLLATDEGRPVPVARVLEGLDAIHAALTDRQRSELLSASFRSRQAASLDAALERGGWDPVDDRVDVEGEAAIRSARRAFERALTALPAEDAAIVRLHYVEGLSRRDVARALHLSGLSEDRLRSIVARLANAVAPAGAGAILPEGAA